MKRFTLLLLAIAVACVVETPRDSRDDGDDKADAGARRDGGRTIDAGDIDAGEVDAGDADAGEVDAGESDGGDSDAGPMVLPRKWGNPVHLAELGSAAWDETPSMSRDMLRVCFSSKRSNNQGKTDIYCAIRSNVGDAFGSPVFQTNINTDAHEWYPIIFGDELYFASDRAGGAGWFDIYRAKWNGFAGVYEQPSAVAELNTAALDHPVGLSPDGLILAIESGRSGSLGNANDIWFSTRANVTSPWSAPINVASLNSTGGEWAMRFAPDMSFALFASERAGGVANSKIWITERQAGGGWATPSPADIRLPSNFTLWMAEVLPDGSLLAQCQINNGDQELYIIPPRGDDPPSMFQWGTPVPMAELNTSGFEAAPTMTADRLKLCFTSDRSGGLGYADIWCATRASATDPFGTPKNQSAINSSEGEYDPELSSDGTELIFQSYRSGGGDLYRAVWVPAENAFKFPEAVTALNTSSREGGPALTGNDLVLLFHSNRSGGYGDLDLYMAVRSTRSSTFGAPIWLGALDSSYLDAEPALDLNGSRVVFASRRPTPPEQGQQGWRLWGAEFLGNNQWSATELVQFDGYANDKISGAFIASDGSLLFHTDASGNHELYIAPPK
jgi:Tol biopolymer transport system component